MQTFQSSVENSFCGKVGPGIVCVYLCVCVFVRELKNHIFKMAPDEKLILQRT